MSHRRKESDAPEFNHEDNKLTIFLESLRLHFRLFLVKLRQFWYHTDSSGKMEITKRLLRTKQILIFITSGLFIFGTSWFASHPEVHPIVPEYHRVISVPVIEPFPYETRELLDKFDLQTDSTILTGSLEAADMMEFEKPTWQLDFPFWANKSSPAIVTAVFDTDGFERLLKMIFTVQQYAPENHLAIFDMVSSPSRREAKKSIGEFKTRETLETYCNLTQVCSIHSTSPFSLPHIPKYISREAYGAYKPIFIQKILNDFPMVLWMDSEGFVWPTGLQKVWNRTRLHQVSTYQLANNCAASSYTFKKMMPYFGMRVEDLRFDHMIESGSYAFLRTSDDISPLLHLWLNCSLTESCIKPIGCDSRNCLHSCKNVQPRFSYIGCHKYETSALSASLKKLNYKSYTAPHDEYPLVKHNGITSADLGFNITIIKYNISSERHRIQKAKNRRKVNILT